MRIYVPLLFLFALLAFLVWGLSWAGKAECLQFGEDTRLPVEWGVWTDCRVLIDDYWFETP